MAELNVPIADLRTRITFQKPTIVRNPGAAQVATYADIADTPTVWSRWIYDHGEETTQNSAEVAVQRATITIRYRSDVLSSWQIVNAQDGSIWKLITPPENVQNLRRWTVFRVERVKGSA
jgi:head-tail adaptor